MDVQPSSGLVYPAEWLDYLPLTRLRLPSSSTSNWTQTILERLTQPQLSDLGARQWRCPNLKEIVFSGTSGVKADLIRGWVKARWVKCKKGEIETGGDAQGFVVRVFMPGKRLGEWEQWRPVLGKNQR